MRTDNTTQERSLEDAELYEEWDGLEEHRNHLRWRWRRLTFRPLALALLLIFALIPGQWVIVRLGYDTATADIIFGIVILVIFALMTVSIIAFHYYRWRVDGIDSTKSYYAEYPDGTRVPIDEEAAAEIIQQNWEEWDGGSD